eukprot:evm.model.NODE_1643_length_1064_cov_72.937973.1
MESSGRTTRGTGQGMHAYTYTYRAVNRGGALGPSIELESRVEPDNVARPVGLGLGLERFVDDIVELDAPGERGAGRIALVVGWEGVALHPLAFSLCL